MNINWCHLMLFIILTQNSFFSYLINWVEDLKIGKLYIPGLVWRRGAYWVVRWSTGRIVSVLIWFNKAIIFLLPLCFHTVYIFWYLILLAFVGLKTTYFAFISEWILYWVLKSRLSFLFVCLFALITSVLWICHSTVGWHALFLKRSLLLFWYIIFGSGGGHWIFESVQWFCFLNLEISVIIS